MEGDRYFKYPINSFSFHSYDTCVYNTLHRLNILKMESSESFSFFPLHYRYLQKPRRPINPNARRGKFDGSVLYLCKIGKSTIQKKDETGSLECHESPCCETSPTGLRYFLKVSRSLTMLRYPSLPFSPTNNYGLSFQ